MGWEARYLALTARETVELLSRDDEPPRKLYLRGKVKLVVSPTTVLTLRWLADSSAFPRNSRLMSRPNCERNFYRGRVSVGSLAAATLKRGTSVLAGIFDNPVCGQVCSVCTGVLPRLSMIGQR